MVGPDSLVSSICLSLILPVDVTPLEVGRLLDVVCFCVSCGDWSDGLGKPKRLWILFNETSSSACSPVNRLFFDVLVKMSLSSDRMIDMVSSGACLGKSQLVGKNSTVLLTRVALLCGT